MTRHQKLSIEQSVNRQRLGELLDVEARSDAETTELTARTTRARALEGELQAALLAEPEPETRQVDAQDRELRSLLDRASVGVIFEAALERRGIDGVERELQEHFGLASNQIPLALLETRAVTPAPGQVDQNQQAIVPMVFPASVAGFLGIPMPTVPVGDAVYPVLTAGASPQTPNENAAISPTDDTGSFAANVLTPRRLQTSFLYSREDRARFAGMDAALRQNLSDAMADSLDEQLLTGSEGLLTGTKLADHNVNADTGFALYRSNLCYSRIDGKFAQQESDIRLVVGAQTLGNMAAEYHSAGSGEISALDSLRSVGVQVRVSAHVPAAASSKQEVVVRLGQRVDMVMPVWEGLTLIPDEVTKIAEGQIRITSILLFAVKILRTAAWYKQQVQH